MAVNHALTIALDLIRNPALSEIVRRRPLPTDVILLIRIVGGDPEASLEAAQTTGHQPREVRAAAILYLQQVLADPAADSYRVLGVAPEAPQAEIREHMRWLMKWLHPDRNSNGWDAAFAERVLSAWQNLKSEKNRQDYDRRLAQGRMQSSRRRQRTVEPLRLPWVGRRIKRKRPLRAIGVALLLAIGLGLAAVAMLDRSVSGGLVDGLGGFGLPATDAASADAPSVPVTPLP